MTQGRTKSILMVVFIALCSLLTSLTAAAQGWSNGYALRRTVTIDHTLVPNTDQVNFPVLVSGTYSDMATVANGGSVTNANGFDIVFTSDANGSTVLPFEQELYNASTGQFAYWVQISTVSHNTDTTFYLFYGNSSVTTDQSNKTGVWDSNYKGVWHFNQTPNGSGAEKDSTSNGYHGTPASSGITLSSDGIAGGSLFFDGKSASNSVSMSSALPGAAPLTISIWIKTTGENSTAQSEIMNKLTWSSMGWSMGDDGQYNSWTLFRTLPNYNNEATIPRSSINNGVWHYLVGTLLNGNVSLYLDGAVRSTQTYSSMTADTTDPMTVGGFGGNAGGGLLAEARISSTARSADWIAAEYNNQSLPSTFSIIGSAATGPNSLMISRVSPSAALCGNSVTIQGVNFGATQGGSTVSFNGSQITPQSWSDTAIGVNVPTGAVSGPFAVTVNSTTAVGPVLVLRMPCGWLDGDIGSVGVAGTASYANGIFTVKGSGADISGSSDAFHFAYQSLSGDGSIVARVVGLQGGGTYAKPGVMIRETLNAGSTNAFTAYMGNGQPIFDYRSSTGGGTNQVTSNSVSLPYWVKVVRSGNSFSGYTSPDGVNWTQLGSTQTITMAQNVYIGLAVTSQNNSTLSTATFDNVSISSTASPAPVITSISANAGPVGGQTVISGTGFGSTQGNSQILLNNAPMTISSWSSTSITITIPFGATSGYLVVSLAPTMNDSNVVYFTVTTQPLSGWLDVDIGSVGVAGSATYANASGTWTVKGSGADTDAGNSDAFHFAFQFLSSDGSIVARLISVQGGNTYQKAGVMIRETLNNAASTNAFMSFQGNGQAFFAARTSTGASTYQATVNMSLPYWLKVTRSGSSFSGYISPDGVNWTQVGTAQTISMVQNVYIGLGVTSQTNSMVATATFDNVSVNSTASPAPVISGVSVVAGPMSNAALAGVGSQAVISGTGFGTQGSSQVFLNDSPMTVNSWSSTSITITIPLTASSGYMVVSVAPSMNDSNPVFFTVAQLPLLGWLDLDVGSVGVVGSASYSNGTFTIKGSGADTDTASADAFHFAFRTLTGDGSIVARVISLQGGGQYAKPGVMIRETLNPGSTNAFMADQTSGGQAFFAYRTSTGASASSATGGMTLPYWVKAVRSGTSFSGYISPDGLNWTQVGTTQTISMAQTVYIGLAVTSENNSALSTATFDNINVVELTITTGTLVGQVTRSSDGSGVSGAYVQVTQGGAVVSTVHADPNGNYTIFNLNAAPSDVTVSSSGLGSNFTPALFIRAGQITTLNVSLSAAGTISGTVTQADGVTPIQGATITVSVGRFAGSSATSGSNGTYSITGLTAGTYAVQASASGFASSTQSVAVTANSTATANFSLQPQGSGTGSYVYDPLGRLVGVILQNGNTAIYNYDAVGNLLSITRQSSSQLAILTFSPPRGPVGSTVTIYGTGFSSTPSQNTVSFNGTSATVQSATSTQLVVTVPTGATTGPISVTTSAGTVTSSSSFTVGN